MSITKEITQINLFKRKSENGIRKWDTGIRVGRTFRLSYTSAEVLLPDAWKEKAGGVPQGAFLLAYYDSAENESSFEAILLRVIEPTSLPQDQETISSIIEYYQDDINTGSGKDSQLDSVSRYRYSFSGLRCSVLGCFYKDEKNINRFGADLENFYSAHHYSVIKPSCEILSFIVNYRENGVPGGKNDIKIGKIRYSSSQRFQSKEPEVPVYVHAQDFAGKRTALFGMTRTGKSNTAKKIIQANVEMSDRAGLVLDKDRESAEKVLEPFGEDGAPKYPIGQIIFDINGEYANPNLQDKGTAIFEMYKDQTTRYSTVQKKDCKVMKVNFYKEIKEGFSLIIECPSIACSENIRFIDNFRTVTFEKPDNYSESTRYDRKVAVYLCCLFRAGFTPPNNFKVKFCATKEVCEAVGSKIIPGKKGSIELDLEKASNWWEKLWKIYNKADVFREYLDKREKEWADNDLKSLLTMLTRRQGPGEGQPNCNGHLILRKINPQHTSVDQDPFDEDILKQLRAGRIVIVDLSLGDEEIQKMFSKRITRHIFNDALKRFTETKPNNFIQFYFEEAHNLFPKKEDKDLSQIYNRLAKEGAKLHLGLIYATQEVTSISNNILKATQNWFISHLNNKDEIKELTKYYDFSDFTEGLIRFSQDTDKGFVRMKAYSNAFVVPVQIDRFPPENATQMRG